MKTARFLNKSSFIKVFFHFIVFGFLICFAVSCSQQEKQFQKIKKLGLVADSCMVVTAHPLASQVGVEIMKKGGNAIDASIAVQFALAVVHPSAGNIGGGGFMVLRMNEGEYDALDFRETAPLSAHRDLYLDSLGEVIDGLSLDGHLAAGVPGTVDGMWEAYSKYGSLTWEELVQPAIDLAQNGFVLTQKEADGLNSYTEKKASFNSQDPLYITAYKWQKGDTVVLNDLAMTLVKIRDEKRNGFYSGEVADKIVDEMNRGGGIISYEDLISYKSVWREPITGNYKDYKLISMSPPSSGGICLYQMLKMIEPYPIKKWGFHSVESIHLMVEVERRSFADRAQHLGDPDFVNVSNGLMDSMYLLNKMNDYKEKHASFSETIFPGDPYPYESEETTHYSIVDPYGNAVSVTTTLNASYGSGVMVGDAGFLLNNEMDDFSSKPGTPNLYGLVGGEANAIQPKKRMLSSMTPSILEKNGELFMVVGTPGGSTIITGVFQTIMNVIEFDLSMQEAVSAGRFHHQWLPDEIKIETYRFNDKIIESLGKMGHQFNEVNSMNRIDAILVLPDGRYEGGADPRGDDKAIGF